ncbi:hypothetical protein HN51_053237 [Arachis hypogaea]|uniref:Fucosyltransferase n=2 Tax=Arachis hypogaea TaxID=3818 RepID=A0A6B9V2N6_ARAHY|nr:probable fucosyltransferase 8 [Arachis ipaensis]XP_025679770.1 probable fucosyltransferase 8 [Arachis hypogaea]QHN75557.1 Galactoside 2-alpha-L-fucosyltransferase [Arachis hypogaea]
MEILDDAIDNMGLSNKKVSKLLLVLFIVIPLVFITTTSMCKISNNFLPFEGFQKVLLEGRYQNDNDNNNNHSMELEGRGIVQNMTHENSGGGEEEKNNTIEVSQGKVQNNCTASQGTVTDGGPKNNTQKLSTNDSKNSTTHDKFLDGLLPSGFDESTCLSRYQSHLYRKPSNHKPSPYLISKLRNYEEFHKRCGPNSRAYKIAMQKITTPSSKTHHHYHHHNDNVDAAKCKYLVWTPVNGLGNRMISIAAAFLFAVLTDRVLLVRFEADMHGLFCEPFHGSTWILPMNSPFWNHENVETYQSIVLAKVDKARNLTLDQLLLPSVLFINLQHTKEDPEMFFHCDHNQEALKKVNVLIVQSDQYFVPSLFMTPSFSHDMNKMFPEKDAVFHHVGRYLFHPSNEAWGQISKFYDTYLAKADERIGLQIRVFRPTFTPQQAVMDLLLSCATSNKILPEVDTQNPAGTTASKVGRNNHTLKAVVVASLYPEYGENLRSMYLKGPTITGEVIRVYQPSHEEKQKFKDNVHNIKALVDMYLLSLCDVLVTSSLSTFGYVAQGFGGLKPWLLYGLVSNETHFPPCLRDLSPEPCYHFPPQHQCNGNSKEHFAASFPHMFECKDYYRGVKLGDGVVH